MYNSIRYDELDGDFILIDLRSPEEYEEFTIPGAINLPLFNNEERKLIGTVYNHESIDKAKKIGVDFASEKLPAFYDEITKLRKEHDKVVLFCERGGLRSSTVCALLSALGAGAVKLSGGYKGYRSVINAMLPELNSRVQYIVIHGYTGTGKTVLLKMLEGRGHDVLDLEKYANHRGSLLGDVGLGNRVSQKQFESLVYDSLKRRKTDIVFVEGESSRIGNIVIPYYIMESMKAGRHILAEGSLEARVDRIVQEYTQGADYHTDIKNSLEKLGKHISAKRIEEYTKSVEQGKYSEVAKDLMVRYYDPMYENEQKGFKYELTVNTDSIEEACDSIEKWLENGMLE
ncbi:MAG TPA: tRNA 2-selenouridine(34) synthase MnmH [Clostridia bacterium]|nr:tRNA 2-selenouridine(34) synthase MnmH [Clostridia bacterium]